MKLSPFSRTATVATLVATFLAAGSIPSFALVFGATVLAKEGDTSPDYAKILDNGPALNNSGRVAFGVRLSTDNQSAIIATGFTADSFLFRQGRPAPDKNGTFHGFSQFGCNKAGMSAFVGTLSGATPSDALKGAFVSQTSEVQVIRGAQPAPGGNGKISAISAGTPAGGIATNSLGEIAGRVQLEDTTGGSNDDVAIYRGDGGPLVEVVRKGQLPPGGGGSIVELGAPSINDTSQVAFWARLTGGSTFGFYLHDGSGLVKMAKTGEAVPGGPIFTFDNTETPVNASGHIVFAARTSSSNANRTLVLATGSQFVEIARTGASAPGGGNFVDFTTFDTSTQPVSLNDRDALAFSARITSGASTLFALFTWDGSALHRIAAKGLPAPGGSGNFNDFGRPAINSNGDVVFYATLTGTSDTGLFFYDVSAGTLDPVIRTGTALAGGILGDLTFLNIPHLGSPFNGFNDSGQVAFRYRLNGGSAGIALASPNPLPPTTITVESTDLTASEFTVAWSISNNAGTDIYRSSDLLNWGSPISTNNIADTFTDSPRPAGTAFYALVPSGQSFP